MTTPAGETSPPSAAVQPQTPEELLNDGHGDAKPSASTEVVIPAAPQRQLWSEITDDEYEGDSEYVRSCLAQRTVRRQREQSEAAAALKAAEQQQHHYNQRHGGGLTRTTTRRDRGGASGHGGPKDNRNRLSQDLAIWTTAAGSKPVSSPSPLTPSLSKTHSIAHPVGATQMDRKARIGGLRSLSALISNNAPATTPPETPAPSKAIDSSPQPPTPTPAEEVKEIPQDKCNSFESPALKIDFDAKPRVEHSLTPFPERTKSPDTPSTVASPIEDGCGQGVAAWSSAFEDASSPCAGKAKSSSIDSTPEPDQLKHASPSVDNMETQLVPTLTTVDGDVIFDERFDIWYTDPESIKRKGVHKEAYEGAMQKVGSFKRLSDFYEFHNALDWSAIREGSIIAYCREGIKPQWEDPANEMGGRYLVKQFNRNETESVFTKIALGFFAGMLHDWNNYNLVSLHVRAHSRGTDVQLWRRGGSQVKLPSSCVKSDIFAFVDIHVAGSGLTVSWVPNSESLLRNDSRLQHAHSRKGGKGGRRSDSYREASTVADVYGSIDAHPVHQLFEDKGKFKLSAEERRYIANKAAEEGGVAASMDSLMDRATTEGDPEHCLDGQSSSDSGCLSHNLHSESAPQKQRMQGPYPDYDMPFQAAAYHYGKQKLLGRDLGANTWAPIPVDVWAAGGAPPGAVYLDPYGQPCAFPGTPEEWYQYCIWQQTQHMQTWQATGGTPEKDLQVESPVVTATVAQPSS